MRNRRLSHRTSKHFRKRNPNHELVKTNSSLTFENAQLRGIISTLQGQYDSLDEMCRDLLTRQLTFWGSVVSTVTRISRVIFKKGTRHGKRESESQFHRA